MKSSIKYYCQLALDDFMVDDWHALQILNDIQSYLKGGAL